MTELATLYKSRLEQLDVYVPERINTTCLKDRILKHCSALYAIGRGRAAVMAMTN